MLTFEVLPQVLFLTSIDGLKPFLLTALSLPQFVLPPAILWTGDCLSLTPNSR